jgi:hypothetical protein
MSDLDKNIRRKDGSDPFDKIIVNPIEKERREKDKGYQSLHHSSRPQVFAALISYFKKILSTLGSKGKFPTHLFDQKRLVENVIAFRKLLLTLAKEDVSHNPDFTEQLGQLWHNLMDDCNSLEPSQSFLPETNNKLKFFISQIQNFPPGADHTLGYYFTEYAGNDWIPFPFMELLRDLHDEYHASPPISVLQNWISLLNDILSSAGIKKD